MGPAGSMFEGKTLDEAVRKGLDALGLTRAEVSITVVEEGSGGFLGFGARPFKVRVAPRPGGAIREAAVREDDDRRSRDRGGRGRDRGGRGGRDRGRGGDRGRDRGDRSGGGRGRGDDSRREERGQPAMAGGERSPRGERGERADRGDRGDRGPRGERGDRGERGERGDRGGRGGRDERRPDDRRNDEGTRGGDERRRHDDRRRSEDRGAPVQAERAPAAARGEEEFESDRPMPAAGEGREGREGGGRRRRRRGRRGGSGGGREASAGAGAVMTMPAADNPRPVDAIATPVVDAPERWTEEEAPMAPMASESQPSNRGRDAAPGGGSPALSGDALAVEGKRCTEQLLSAMGFEATLRATVDGDRVTVVATIEDGENLIAGERDEVRQAMQQILNRMINRGEGSHYHLQLEINDFWEKRETDLKALAARLAEDALAKNGEVVTDYLNAQERRIIHVTLREDARVKTWSLGIGHIKRLAVAPADYAGGPAGES